MRHHPASRVDRGWGWRPHMHVHECVFSCVWLFVILWTVALRPWNFPGKNTEVGFHFLLQGIFPTPGIESVSPALTGRFFTTGTTRGAWRTPSFSTNQCHIRRWKSMGGNKYNGCRNWVTYMETGLYLKGPFLFFFSFPKSLLNLLQYCFSFVFWFFGCKSCGIFSSLARDQTPTTCIGRQSLINWTTRGVPKGAH